MGQKTNPKEVYSYGQIYISAPELNNHFLQINSFKLTSTSEVFLK